MANIPHIANEEDYNLALARMDEIFYAAIGTREGDERDLLFDLIEAYEERCHPVDLPSIPAAIEFHMDQLGLTSGDLAPLVGSQKAAAAVLSGKMDITMAMARALHKHWGIPAEVLLQEPAATHAPSPRVQLPETGASPRCAGQPCSAARAAPPP